MKHKVLSAVAITLLVTGVMASVLCMGYELIGAIASVTISVPH